MGRKSLKIATFNVGNLVPTSTETQQNYFYQQGKGNQYEEVEYQQKIEWIAKQLDTMDADIVGFQEVFDLAPLVDAVNLSQKFGGSNYNLEIADQNPEVEQLNEDGQAINIYKSPQVAVLSVEGFQIELTPLSHFPENMNVSNVVNDKAGRSWQLALLEGDAELNKFHRIVIKATITLPEEFKDVEGVEGDAAKLTIFVSHLKSKGPLKAEIGEDAPDQIIDDLREDAIGKTRSLLIRTLEATALRHYVIDELHQSPDVPLLVLGDLNDGIRSVSTEIAGGLSQRYYGREEDRNRVADLSLYSAYDFQTENTHRDIYYSYIFNGFHQTLDHILVSSHFIPRWWRKYSGRQHIGTIGRFQMFNDHVVDEEVDNLRFHKKKAYQHTKSDHGQAIVRLDWYTKDNKEQVILDLLNEWAHNTKLNLQDEILTNHSDDVVIYDVLPPLKYEGKEAYRNSWDEWQPETNGESFFDFQEIQVTAGNNVSFAHGLIHCGGTRPDGTTFEDTVRATFCLEKIENKWTVTHQHISQPLPE